MRLIKLVLHNYCQYEDFTVVFEDGVNVLRGRNGKGKSNLMNAVFYCLSGDSFIKNKTRSGMLKWGCKKGFAELHFKMHGGVYIINRSLHSSAVKLERPSGDDITKSSEASAFIRELIKADSDVLKLSSFMPQAGANELVFGTPTERQTAFSRLFRLIHLESHRTALQKEFNKIPVYNDVSDIITTLVSELAILKASLEELDKDKTSEYLKNNKDKYQSMYDTRNCLYKETEYKEVHSDLINKKDLVNISINKIIADISAIDDPVILTSAETEMYRGYKEFEQVCVAMLAAKEKVDKPMLAEEVTDAQVADAQDSFNRSCQLYNETEKKLDLWQSGKCGECGTDFKHTPEEIKALDSELLKINNEGVRLSNELVALRAYKTTFDKAKMINDQDKEAFATLQKQVVEKSYIYDNYNEQAFLDKQEEAGRSQEILRKQSELNRLKSEKQGELSKIEMNISSLDSAGFKPNDFSKDFMDTYSATVEKQQEKTQQKASISTAVELKSEQLAQRKKEQKLAVLADAHRKFITDLRLILHVDNYPRLAVSIYKENLSIIINKYLDIFGQPFTINIDDSLEFVCVFSDNPKVNAEESLSGGQKAMLLVSVRLAIAEMLAKDVELLTFDEPGAPMDKEAKQDLLEAFDTVRKYLAGKRIQILVASHDDNIEGIADNVIHL